MKNKKALIKRHASQYIAAIFEPHLRNAGFVCPDNDLLCWYRIRSPEIFNSIIFYSRWSALPLFLDIGYGIVPSFEMPINIKGVVYNYLPDKELFTSRSIVENYPNGGTKAAFSQDILVNAPMQDSRGLYTLTELLLPDMDRIQTVDEAYYFHKNRRINHPTAKYGPPGMPYGKLSKTFVNMALWADDEEMYPYALTRAYEAVDSYSELCIRFPNRQNYQKELCAWERLLETLENDDRDSYLKELSLRMEQNTKRVKKRYCGDV